MKHSKLTPPKTSSLANRKGGNGGFAKKSSVKEEKMTKHKKNYRDYHGKNTV